MKNSRILAILFAVGTGALFLAAPVSAQTHTSAPLVVQQDVPKRIWLKAEVIHADAKSIMVREQAGSLAIHTFTYSEKIKDAMQKLMDKGGYQSGDKVKILYEEGQTLALKVKGKPSKPL
jgi:hypothetical protein